MQIIQEPIDALRAHVSVTLEKSDYEGRCENSLKAYRKQAQMPGFRKGKIPMGLIRKQFGRNVLADELNKLLSEALQNYIEDKKLDVLGNPIPSETIEDSGDWNNPDSFTFHYEIGLAPKIKLDLKKAKFTRNTIPVDKKTIDNRIKDMQRQHGKVNDVEKSGDKDMIIGTFVQLDDKGEILKGGIESRSSISIEFVDDKKMTKKLVGLKKNDVVVLNPHKVAKGNDDLGRMLGITNEQVDNLKGEFKFGIEEIKSLEEHEVNQELFDKIYPQGEVKDLKDFKLKIKKDLEDYFDRDAEWVFRKRFVVDLVEHMNIELPDAFLKRWIMLTNEKPVTSKQLDAEFDGYADSLRWQLVQKAVMTKHEIKVTADELEIESKKFINAQYAQYGMPMDEETMTNVAKSMLEKDDERRRIADVIIERKVVDHLKTLVTIKEKTISYEKFAELAAEVK